MLFIYLKWFQDKIRKTVFFITFSLLEQLEQQP